MCNLEFQNFQNFNLYYVSEGYQRLKYVLELRTSVADKLPDDGTLLPKHVGVDTWYLVCFVIRFIVFLLVHFVGF